MSEIEPTNRNTAFAIGALLIAAMIPIAAAQYAAEHRLKPEQIQSPVTPGQ